MISITTPQEIAEALKRDYVSVAEALACAERIAAMNGPLSADYWQAAEILRNETHIISAYIEAALSAELLEVPRGL